MSLETLDFLDPGLLVDDELELVLPAEEYIDDILAACRHPLTVRDMPLQAKTTRDELVAFLYQHPQGFTRGDPFRQLAPAYTFWMRLRTNSGLPVSMAGSIGLRLAHNTNLELYLGHIGYHVYPPARGRHFAQRACRLVLPLARAHGFSELWITTNPDNLPSRRTCERLGATLVDIVPLPRTHPLYAQGDREKCRYRLTL